MGRRRALMAVGTVAAATTLLVSGCTTGQQADSGTSRAAATSSGGSRTPSGPTGPTGGTRTPTPPATPPGTFNETTLTGTAVRGVEPGCVGLRTNGKTYLLAGDAPRKLADDGGSGQRLGRVKVEGHFAPKDMATTCMMGRVFVVVDLQKL